jgi:hypothetical protein
MKTADNHLIGKIIYSLTFMVLLPVGLVIWAKNTALSISLPAVQSLAWGQVLFFIGAALMASGMYALWRFGKGLPMNGYPPPGFVRERVYALMPHPIYTGFVFMCFGAAIYLGDAAGFWLVSPVALLGCVALAWGFERIDLQKRFPDAPRQYVLGIAPDSKEKPSVWQRFSVYLCLFLPWILLNAAAFWAVGVQARPGPFFNLPDLGIPDLWKFGIGMAALVWVAAAPLFARTQQQLRRFFLSGLMGSAAVLYLAFLLPVIGLGHAVLWTEPFWAKAVMSISWFWIWPAARIYHKAFLSNALPVNIIAILLTGGLMVGSVDPVAHSIAGLLGFAFALFYPIIWEELREIAESVANSWKEWTFGPLRVINHGFYVGIAAFLGTIIGALLAGEEYAFAIVVFGVIGTVCAGLWGQFIEGSDKLKRPFGYYGSVVGLVFGSIVMRLMGVNVWVMLGIFSVFMPWVQGIGRLRCLVNGCCHGAPSNELVGIRYVHPRSRVCFISGLKGKPLHPTPLYSLLWMALVGGLQWRLWQAGASLSLIFGMYLILNGLGRFVEEAYRGEPQTPVWGKLRLYQWAAVVTVLAGIIATFFEAPMPVLTPVIGWQSVAGAAFMGFFTQFLMGIDFPKSNMRFSRLT